MTRRGVVAALGMAAFAVNVRPLMSQALRVSPMAQAVLVDDYSAAIPGHGSVSEVRVVQPVLAVVGHAFGDRFGFTATVDLEGATIKSGELTPGAWGEGFVDRRHPHTTIHELNIDIDDILGALDRSGQLNLILGKGFVPFGTDDPMSRPFERYPVNHHLSQILERAVAIAQYEFGAITIEGAIFNGDEPTRPSDWPLLRTDQRTWRFGDSRSVRLTARPLGRLELQGSLAHVHSPEARPGGGPDAEKASLSARWFANTVRSERYALVEWARTSELGGVFVYHTLLGEGLVTRGRWRGSYRFERTERPEELRLVDPFRTQRPSPDNSILGISRWSLHTLHIAYDLVSPRRKLEIQPFIEVTLGRVARVGGGIFDPVSLYGTDQVRELAVGVLAGWGMRRHRMGRYGALSSRMDGRDGMKM